MKKKHLGFTLIELMVTISVAAIMLLVVGPSMRGFIEGARLRTAASDLSSSFVYARSESIKRGLNVSVCKSADIEVDSPECDNAATWTQGWLVFVDRNADGDFNPVSGAADEDILLRVGKVDAEDLQINPGTNFANYLSYAGNGRVHGAEGAAGGVFQLCLNGQDREIAINATGRVAVSSGVC